MRLMKNKKIIIISASANVRNFFALEALNFDFTVEVAEKITRAYNDISSYDLSIIDVDTVKQMPLNSAKRQITVSSQGKRADIVYPCLISEVREIYNGLYSQSSLKSDSTDDGIKIVFYESQSDTNKNLVCVNNRKYILSDTEYKILTLLCKSPQEAISREKIQGLLENEKSNIGDVYICRLRKKLEEPLGQRLIFTVRGKGYKIVADAEWR